MNSSLIKELGYVVLVIAIPVAIVSLIAKTFADRNSRRLYWCGVLIAICVTAIVAMQALRLQPYHVPAPFWREAAGALVAWAPVFLLPAVIVWPPASRPAKGVWVPIRAAFGVLLSMPVGFILGLAVR